MLELDLDMEADLGIDTVSRRNCFAALREHYGITAQGQSVTERLSDHQALHQVRAGIDRRGNRESTIDNRESGLQPR